MPAVRACLHIHFTSALPTSQLPLHMRALSISHAILLEHPTLCEVSKETQPGIGHRLYLTSET